MSLEIFILLVATSLVQLAIGYANTFLSLRVAQEGFGPYETGAVLSSYFLGSLVGAVAASTIIGRVGQVRAYAGFAATIALASVLMPLWILPLPWFALRIVFGFGAAGVFVTTESWLNGKAPPE